MPIYNIGNDGITVCHEAPTTANEGEIGVAMLVDGESDPMTPSHGQEGHGATPAKFPRETDASLTVPPPRGPLVYERDREFECRHKKSASRCRPSTKMAARAIIISGM
jgi:hypothetical protein